MNSLINNQNDPEAGYKEYEELLVRRDRLLREAGSYLTGYNSEFGDMIAQNHKLKNECIRMKKSISYCRRRMNRGLNVDTEAMNTEVEKEMKLYCDPEAPLYKTMEDPGMKIFITGHNSLEVRKELLECQILDILATAPYTYGELLNDEDKKKAYADSLNEEKKDFENYLEGLKMTLDDILIGLSEAAKCG